uniref:Uncharacterized protein n=1 Tax=Anguilla anguilla TaxID=7936 RepID=A0A0E9U585_ANGAN
MSSHCVQRPALYCLASGSKVIVMDRLMVIWFFCQRNKLST